MQEDERFINPVNDEMSPVGSFDPGTDEEPTVPMMDMK